MDELIRLLQIEGVSTVGLLLVAGLALWKGWLVLGPTHTKITEALKATTAELKEVEQEFVEARIELARLEERDDLRSDPTTPRRRKRVGSP